MDFIKALNDFWNKKGYKGYFMIRRYRSNGPLSVCKVYHTELYWLNKGTNVLVLEETNNIVVKEGTDDAQVYTELDECLLSDIFANLERIVDNYGI